LIIPLFTDDSKRITRKVDKGLKKGPLKIVPIYLLHNLMSVWVISASDGYILVIFGTMQSLIMPIWFGFAMEGKIFEVPGLYKFIWGVASLCILTYSLWRAIEWANWSVITFISTCVGSWPAFIMTFDAMVLAVFCVYFLFLESGAKEFNDKRKKA